ncbi:MAG TPA: hypothetical protein VK718_03505 [Ferruginibacter sp.]|jgi:hypothetical protein|nr:hypothetical protein [Ferruginibacter sp.]
MRINNATDLKAAIHQLEAKQLTQKQSLRNQFYETYESLKPLNIIKSEFKKFTSSPDIKSNIVNTAIGLGAGILTKKVFIGGSANIFKKLFGSVIEMGIAKLVSGNADKIKDMGKELLHPANGRVL